MKAVDDGLAAAGEGDAKLVREEVRGDGLRVSVREERAHIAEGLLDLQMANFPNTVFLRYRRAQDKIKLRSPLALYFRRSRTLASTPLSGAFLSHRP